MGNPTSWYYASHKKGAFLHQQLLCDTVRWTTCNLEGQELKSPTVLSAIQGNPLTIRLLALDKAIKYFDNFKRIEKRIKKLSREKFDKKQFFAMGGKWEAEGSSLNTKGAPIEVIETLKGETFELRYTDIQLALYEFFTNFGSILDRLAYEVNLLYALRIKQYYVDWGTLTKIKTNKENKYITKLMKKDKDLATLLESYAKIFELATRYRNRLVHDGIIKVDVHIRIVKLGIMLAENPDKDNSPMNKDAINFCENTRIELLSLLENSYGKMFEHFKVYGNPPW